MTDREQKRLEELLAKKEAEEKADAEFFKQVRRRRDDVLRELKVKECAADPREHEYMEKFQKVAERYGVSVDTLLEYINTDKQVNYYVSYVKKG